MTLFRTLRLESYMKIIFSILCLLSLVACNYKGDGIGWNADVNYYDAELPLQLPASAEKTLTPKTQWTDFVYQMPRLGWVSVPQKLEVTLGNASNHHAQVEIGPNICLYKGGSTYGEVVASNDPVELAAGSKYGLLGCLDKSGVLHYGAFEFLIGRDEVIRVHIIDADPASEQVRVETLFYLHQ